MKGVILAGGTGSRLLPLTKVTNKHLLPVGCKPMILWPVSKLTEAGIRDILIVTGTEHMGDIVNLLGSGTEFGCEFTYKVQDQAGGIAQALGLARTFAAGGKLCVILGDNIFEDALTGAVAAFEKQPAGAQILLKHVPDANRYGVAELDGQGRVVGIEEKPAAPKSDCAVTGIYFYDASVFEVIQTLKPSRRNELEITDVNNHYIQAGTLHCAFLQGWWTDAGTFKSLAHANQLLEEADHGADKKGARMTVRKARPAHSKKAAAPAIAARKSRAQSPEKASTYASFPVGPLMIDGVRLVPLDRHDDPRGWLTELYRDDELPAANRPVMAYVSATLPGEVRGPHEHRHQSDIFCFIGPGDFEIHLWDNRKRSPTFETHACFVLGASCPCRLTIPPGVVHGYKNISRHEAVCFNAPNKLYRGRGKKSAVDEIRHEADPASPFRID